MSKNAKNHHEVKIYLSTEEREQIRALAARKGIAISKLLHGWFKPKLQAELIAERLTELKKNDAA